MCNLEPGTWNSNFINWLSSIQEDSILKKVEKIQQEKADWWDTTSEKDKKCINEGLEQLDRGEHLTHSQVRSKIKERFNFK
jgi:predicted transcriptional regulator